MHITRPNRLLKLIQQSDFLSFGIVYAIMHGGILLVPEAIFWDDWVLFRNSPQVILDSFKQAGVFFNLAGYLQVFLLDFGLWSYKVLTFALMFAAGMLFNSILKRNLLLSDQNRFFVVLLFLILPFNLARVALINFPSVLCYFLFFLGWRLADKHRIISAVLFVLSFNVNSLLVFFVLPFLDVMHRGGYLKSPSSVLYFLRARAELVAIPFLYFYIKITFFKPSGLYEGYNENYTLLNIWPALTTQFKDLTEFRIHPVLFILFFLLVLPFVHGRKKEIRPLTNLNLKVSNALLLGMAALLLAEFPYLILALTPTFMEWASRHQLLMPLGAALLIVASLSFVKARLLHSMLMSAVIASSLAFGVSTYFSFYLDWDKQHQIISLLSANQEIKNAKLVIMKDEATSSNAIKRTYRLYEWSGLLERAYGDETRFGLAQGDLTQYANGGFDNFFRSWYKVGGHQRSDGNKIVLVKINKVPRSDEDGLLTLPKFYLSTIPIPNLLPETIVYIYEQ